MGGFDSPNLAVSSTEIRLEKYGVLMRLDRVKLGMC